MERDGTREQTPQKGGGEAERAPGRVALITGASSGIGKALTELLTAEPAYFSPTRPLTDFWLIARRGALLERLAEGLRARAAAAGKPLRFRILTCDLSDDDEVGRLCALIAAEQPALDVVVNCAGGGRFGPFMEVPAEDALRMVDVNVRALVRLSRACLPLMGEGGHLLQIASSAGFAPLPGMAIYSATKAFVIRFSRALSLEQAARGVHVCAVCPGAVATEFFDHANLYVRVESLSKKYMISTAEEVARHALSRARRGKDMAVYSLPIKLARLLCKVLPHRLVGRFWQRAV